MRDGIIDECLTVSDLFPADDGVAAFAEDPVVVARFGAQILGQAPDANKAFSIGVREEVLTLGPIRSGPLARRPKTEFVHD